MMTDVSGLGQDDQARIEAGVWPTPAQWVSLFVDSGPERQLEMAERVMQDSQRADKCFVGDHDGRLAALVGELTATRAELHFMRSEASTEYFALHNGLLAAEAQLAEAKAAALREALEQARRGHANGVIHWLAAYISEQSGIAARAAALGDLPEGAKP